MSGARLESTASRGRTAQDGRYNQSLDVGPILGVIDSWRRGLGRPTMSGTLEEILSWVEKADEQRNGAGSLPLKPSDLEIIEMLCADYNIGDIAERLQSTPRTIQKHVRDIRLNLKAVHNLVRNEQLPHLPEYDQVELSFKFWRQIEVHDGPTKVLALAAAEGYPTKRAPLGGGRSEPSVLCTGAELAELVQRADRNSCGLEATLIAEALAHRGGRLEDQTPATIEAFTQKLGQQMMVLGIPSPSESLEQGVELVNEAIRSAVIAKSTSRLRDTSILLGKTVAAGIEQEDRALRDRGALAIRKLQGLVRAKRSRTSSTG